MCTYLAILRIRAKVLFLLDTYDSHQIHPYLLTIFTSFLSRHQDF